MLRLSGGCEGLNPRRRCDLRKHASRLREPARLGRAKQHVCPVPDPRLRSDKLRNALQRARHTRGLHARNVLCTRVGASSAAIGLLLLLSRCVAIGPDLREPLFESPFPLGPFVRSAYAGDDEPVSEDEAAAYEEEHSDQDNAHYGSGRQPRVARYLRWGRNDAR